jgi:DNA-binding MarR family transcriptional regulator
MPSKPVSARPRQGAENPGPHRASGRDPLNHGGLDQLIGYHLRLAQISVFRDFADTTREFDISPGWVGLLMLIKHNPGLTQSRLAQAIGIDRSTLVNSLDRLEARKLVLRSASPTDRRANVLQLTAAGEEVLGAIMPLILQHEGRLKECLGEEAPRFLKMLARLATLGGSDTTA